MNIKSFSKEGQDILALNLVSPKGFFLDIGCGDPVYGNNSFLLETLGWQGILVDGDRQSIERADRYRTSPVVLGDVTQMDWGSMLKDLHAPSMIDFISMDTDSANAVLAQKFPFDKYQFKVLTFEHDRYQGSDERKDACYKALAPYPQYVKLLDNGISEGLEWEDWWVNTDFVDIKFLKKAASSMDWRAFLDVLLKGN